MHVTWGVCSLRHQRGRMTEQSGYASQRCLESVRIHKSTHTHTVSHTNTHKSLLSVPLALCGPCPRSQAAVCMAVPSVASHWGGTQPCRSPDERASFRPSPAVRLREEVGSQLWLTVVITTTTTTTRSSTLSFNQPHLLQRDRDMTDAADLTWTQNPKRSKHVQKRTCHGDHDATHVSKTCLTYLGNLHCSVITNTSHQLSFFNLFHPPFIVSLSLSPSLPASSRHPLFNLSPPSILSRSFFLWCTLLGCGCLISTPSALHGPLLPSGSTTRTLARTDRQTHTQHSLDFPWQGLVVESCPVVIL